MGEKEMNKIKLEQCFEHGGPIGKFLIDGIKDIDNYEIIFKDGSRLVYNESTRQQVPIWDKKYMDPIPEEGQDPGEGGSYKCPYCDWSCGWVGVLSHMKDEHKIEKELK